MTKELKQCIAAIEDYIKKNYRNNFREPCEGLPYKYLVPGGFSYSHQLWDWDSWLTGVALLHYEEKEIEQYEKGCVLNFIKHIDEKGRIPILVQDTPSWLFDLTNDYHSNIHKPCLAIHSNEISKTYSSYEWLREVFGDLERFISYYDNYQRDDESGLYYWIDDLGLGFDNDPTAFYRPNNSTATIYLNSLMYQELYSMYEIAKGLKNEGAAAKYLDKANKLKDAINKECYDPIDGFYYSCDVSLRKTDPNEWLHKGHQRFWSTLPIKITTWAGMLPLWNKIASQEQADKVVKHYLLKDGLFSGFGIRSVAKYEKMFGNFDTGNPSCWLGPIWINANYFTFVGLLNYGYNDLAKDIAIKTITLLGNDIIKNGCFHEYYHSENGEGIRGKGFQSWNFLVLLLINYLKHCI